MEIIVYGDGDFVAQILQAVSISFDSGAFWALLKLAAIMGMVGAIAMAVGGNVRLPMQHFAGVAIVVAGLISPTATVEIVDSSQKGIIKIHPVERKIKGVPLGIALPWSISSNAGYFLAKLFEDSFSPITNPVGIDLKPFHYTRSGLMLAHAAAELTLNAKISDANLAKNLNSFWKNCVFYDLALGRYSEADISKSLNLVQFFSDYVSRARSFTYVHPSSVGSGQQQAQTEVISCKIGWDKYLSKAVESEHIKSNETLGSYVAQGLGHLVGDFTGSGGGLGGGTDIFAGARTGEYSLTVLGLASSAAAKNTVQALLYNNMKDATRFLAGDTDSTALLSNIAIAQAEQDQKVSLVATTKLAKKYIPMLKSLADCILFSVAPIVFVIALMGNGLSVFGHYVKAIFSLSLWPLMFSILNVIMIYKTQSAMTALGVTQGGGITFLMLSTAPSVLLEQGAIAGALCMAIPVLSHAIVYGSASSLGGSLTGSVAGAQSAAASTVQSLGHGNVSFDNQSYGNITANQQRLAPSLDSGYSSVNTGSGIESRMSSNGLNLKSDATSLPITASSDNRESVQNSQRLASASAKESAAGSSFAASSRAAFDKVARVTSSLLASNAVSNDQKEQLKDALSFADDKVNSNSRSADRAYRDSEKTGYTTKGGIGAKLGIGAGGGAGISGGLGIGVEYAHSNNEEWSDSISGKESTSNASRVSAVDAIEKLDSLNKTVARNSNLGTSDDTSGSISEARSSEKSYRTAESERKSVEKSVQASEANSASVQSNDTMTLLNNSQVDPNDIAKASGGDNAAKGRIFEALKYSSAPQELGGDAFERNLQMGSDSSSGLEGDVQRGISAGANLKSNSPSVGPSVAVGLESVAGEKSLAELDFDRDKIDFNWGYEDRTQKGGSRRKESEKDLPKVDDKPNFPDIEE